MVKPRIGHPIADNKRVSSGSDESDRCDDNEPLLTPAVNRDERGANTTSAGTTANEKPAMRGRIAARMISNVCRVTQSLVHLVWKCSNWGTLLAVLCYYHLDGGVLAFIVILLTCLGLIYNAQDLLLYFPDQPDSSRLFVPPPSVAGIPSSCYENLFILTADRVKINALLLKQTSVATSRVPTLLFFHGNAGNVGHRLINAMFLQSVCHCNVMLVEYRGFGKSEGDPDEEGFYRDAQAALDHLHDRDDINANLIFVFGRSLGGAVAIDLAARHENRDRIRGLIVENTFTSIPDMGSCLFNLGFINWLPLIIVKNRYFSILKVPRLKVPTLFLSGAADELVPPLMMSTLYEKCRGPKKMVVFENGTHNETWQLPGYGEAIRDYLNRHAGMARPTQVSRPPSDLPDRQSAPPRGGGPQPDVQSSESSSTASSSSSYEFVGP